MRKCIVLIAGLGFASMLCVPSSRAGDAGSRGSLEMRDFGKTPDGTPVTLYVLKSGRATVKVMTYGAIVTELHVPDRQGKTADVVLGFDTLEGYLAGHPYFGATVGRFANRIAKGTFTLDGHDYTLGRQQRTQLAPRRAQGIRQGRLEGRGRLRPGWPGGQVHLSQQERRGRIPRQSLGQRDVYAAFRAATPKR